MSLFNYVGLLKMYPLLVSVYAYCVFTRMSMYINRSHKALKYTFCSSIGSEIMEHTI